MVSGMLSPDPLAQYIEGVRLFGLPPLREDETDTLEVETLSAEDAGPLFESSASVVVPKRGKIFEEDGTCKIAIIRPCVSRGRRIRGLPPIYTPSMLAENAGVFKNWVMFQDHLQEEIVEALHKRQRSIRELGGRIVESWYDPEIRLPDDDTYGYRPGAIVARALPQPGVRAMLEADPQILSVSINAWPKGARAGTAPWNPAQKGMLIEGISATPPGSVDWVIRPGAGGTVLAENVALAVSVLEGFYDSATEVDVGDGSPTKDEAMDFSKLTEQEAITYLRENHSELLEAEVRRMTAGSAGTITAEQLQEALDSNADSIRTEFRSALSERETEAEARAQQIIEEREAARELAAYAHQLIESAEGLPVRWKSEIKARYAVLPSGPSAALLVESDEGDGREQIKALVEQDVSHALELLADARPGPVVEGQGGATADGEAERQELTESAKDNAFIGFMQESGGFEKPEDVINAIREAKN